jgi:hypothetical protein
MTLPLLLTIRFSASIPDLELDVPSPSATTVISLKHLLRKRLAVRSRLRLIYQGRLLPDTSALSTVFKVPLAAAAAAAANNGQDGSDQGGAAAVHDAKGKGVLRPQPPPVRIYVNCSIADELSPDELALEATEAGKPPPETSAHDASAAIAGAQPSPSVRPRPRGFDRLLTQGFSQSEISTLRTQFASIHADRFPPDAPPSPDTLRGLEDSWIDSNAGDGLPTAAGAGGGLGGVVGEDDPSGLGQGLDVFIKAMMIGFFFPLGSLTWLLRQEGIWGDRWQIFVAAGAVLSLVTGTIMTISGGR